MPRSRLITYLIFLVVFIVTLSCRQPIQPLNVPAIAYRTITPTESPTEMPTAIPESTKATVFLPAIRKANDPTILTPTPDAARVLPEIRNEAEEYIVQAGDTLATIAARYEINVNMLVNANHIINPDLVETGEELVIPAPTQGYQGLGSKIIPDSELVYGPLAETLDVRQFVKQFNGYLAGYSEEVEGRMLTGDEIVDLVAEDYSVSPRLLLAILEYQSGWVTKQNLPEYTIDYPIGNQDSWRTGLYLQLAWAADILNQGYYLWKVDGIGGWLLYDGEAIPIDPTINAGTAAVQHLFASLYDRVGWDRAVSPDGLFATFSNFFGHPFDYAIEPLIPENLEQPEMQLPFEPGVYWAFTGGPHGGWGEGSAWAALDFAPGINGLGCALSDYWVVAVADGTIIRADNGRVVEELDGDENEGTGWSVLYMHIEERDRVKAGVEVKAGERIGHPSCEGGYSTGTHFHLARRYNGEWIPANQTQSETSVPFNLEGWISTGIGIEYNGYLERDGEYIEAWEGYYPGNTIHR